MTRMLAAVRAEPVRPDRDAEADRRFVGLLLRDASTLVRQGWTTHCWFVAADRSGDRRRIGPTNLTELTGRTVTHVCLVGALVQAGGGLRNARSAPVHRAIEAAWASLWNEPVRWTVSPPTRVAHVRDLTRWNDAPARTADEVCGLLDSAAEHALA